MAYVIAEPCIGTKDVASVDACPVDCIHPKKDEAGFAEADQLFIDPVECIDCGACVPVCPVSAIYAADDLPEKWADYQAKNAAHFALKSVALATICLWGSHAAALGLGRLNVQSALGETLRAEIEVTSLTPEEASSLKLRVAPPEAYRAAGVDYNAVLPSAQVQVVRRPDGRTFLRVTSTRAVLSFFMFAASSCSSFSTMKRGVFSFTARAASTNSMERP